MLVGVSVTNNGNISPLRIIYNLLKFLHFLPLPSSAEPYLLSGQLTQAPPGHPIPNFHPCYYKQVAVLDHCILLRSKHLLDSDPRLHLLCLLSIPVILDSLILVVSTFVLHHSVVCLSYRMILLTHQDPQCRFLIDLMVL